MKYGSQVLAESGPPEATSSRDRTRPYDQEGLMNEEHRAALVSLERAAWRVAFPSVPWDLPQAVVSR